MSVAKEKPSLYYIAHIPGAILEISLRVGVGVIPLNVTPRQASQTYLLSLHTQRVKKPLQIHVTLTAVFCTELCFVLYWFEVVK